jgi:hypothetical protein
MATMIDIGELYGALPSLRARRIYPISMRRALADLDPDRIAP